MMRSIQAEIEKLMHEYGDDRWECIQLYSAEGLLMAGTGSSPVYSQDSLLEFSFSLIETLKLIDSNGQGKEIVIQGIGNRRLVFRYFEAWKETVVLAAVLPGRKGYRRAMTKLSAHIQNIL